MNDASISNHESRLCALRTRKDMFIRQHGEKWAIVIKTQWGWYSACSRDTLPEAIEVAEHIAADFDLGI